MKPKFFRRVLKNGMTVLLEKRDLPVVSVAFGVKTGAAFEKEEEKGISHFVEHMLYKGTQKRTWLQIGEEIEKNGGKLNGFTSDSVVGYWCKMPSSKLGIALDVLSDMIKNSLFDEKEIEKERMVILEEIKMHKDTPRLHVLHKISELLYESPVGSSISGTPETLNKMSRETLFNFFEKVYVPSNMVLSVVGDADFDQLVEFAKKTFSKATFKKMKLVAKKKLGSVVEKRKGVDQANLVFGYHVPLFEDKKSYAAEILNVLMAGGTSSRLHGEIREKRNLAYGILGFLDITKYFASSIIWVGANAQSVDKIKEIIIQEFEKVAKCFSEKELEQRKEQLIGNYKTGMEDSQEQIVNLLFHEAQGDVKKFYEFEKNILGVKLKDVRDLAKHAAKNFSFFALVPDN